MAITTADGTALADGLRDLRAALVEAQATLDRAADLARQLQEAEPRWVEELPRFAFIVTQGLHSISEDLATMSGNKRPACDPSFDFVLDNIEELVELVDCARGGPSDDG